MANSAILIPSLQAPVISGPPFTAGTICTLPGMLGITQSDNLTETMDLNAAIALMPFYVEKDFSTSLIGALVTADLAASTITLGIYGSNSDYLPSGAALAAASAPGTATGDILTSISVDLSAYLLYWAAIGLSSAVTLSISVVKLNVCPGNPGGATVGTTYIPSIFSYPNTYAAGVLPSITPGSLTEISAGFGPLITIT